MMRDPRTRLAGIASIIVFIVVLGGAACGAAALVVNLTRDTRPTIVYQDGNAADAMSPVQAYFLSSEAEYARDQLERWLRGQDNQIGADAPSKPVLDAEVTIVGFLPGPVLGEAGTPTTSVTLEARTRGDETGQSSRWTVRVAEVADITTRMTTWSILDAPALAPPAPTGPPVGSEGEEADPAVQQVVATWLRAWTSGESTAAVSVPDAVIAAASVTGEIPSDGIRDTRWTRLGDNASTVTSYRLVVNGSTLDLTARLNLHKQGSVWLVRGVEQ
jgi:hypothetical protein